MTALLVERSRHACSTDLPPALPHVKSGKLKALAVGGAKRSPLLPDLADAAEGGLDFNTAGWYGILAPPKTSRAIVNALHAATVKALATPAIKDSLTRQGVEVVGSTPEEFAKAHSRRMGPDWRK